MAMDAVFQRGAMKDINAHLFADNSMTPNDLDRLICVHKEKWEKSLGASWKETLSKQEKSLNASWSKARRETATDKASRARRRPDESGPSKEKAQDGASQQKQTVPKAATATKKNCVDSKEKAWHEAPLQQKQTDPKETTAIMKNCTDSVAACVVLMDDNH